MEQCLLLLLFLLLLLLYLMLGGELLESCVSLFFSFFLLLLSGLINFCPVGLGSTERLFFRAVWMRAKQSSKDADGL